MGGLTVPGSDPSRWERIAADAAEVLSRRGGSLAAPDRELLARIAAGEGSRVSLKAVVARVGRCGCDTCVLLQALAVANIAAEAVVAGSPPTPTATRSNDATQTGVGLRLRTLFH